MANKQTKANRADAAKSFQKGNGTQVYLISNTTQGGSLGVRRQPITIGQCARLSRHPKVAGKRSKGKRSDE
jgi:hypothetical protein